MNTSNLNIFNDNVIISSEDITNNFTNNFIKINENNIIVKMNQKKKELLIRIERSKNDASTRLFMVTEAYDKYTYEYYIISLTILILSSIITFVEALRLTIIELNTKEKLLYYNENYFSLVLNITLLITGTIITILSSIIRFKNYREILEGLKEAQTILVIYKNKYNRQFQIINYHYTNKNISSDGIIKISDKITAYDRIVKSINYFQYIKNSDIIAYNKSKAKFDIDIYKIKTDTRNEFELITKKKEQEYINIYNKNDVELENKNYEKFENINDILLKKELYKLDATKRRFELNSEVNKLKKEVMILDTSKS
tara:strand:+ start:3951 stop:4889 length:939 start_codon:yes stop_codon:yes gene_type:complete